MDNIKVKSGDIIDRISIKATRWVGSTSSLLVHTALFILAFCFYFYGIKIEDILLVLTTIVSLEAIYLSIFIQMTVNRQARKLHAVARDVGEIQEDVDEIQKDVDEIQGDIDEIQEDVDEIQDDDEEDGGTKEDEIMLRIESNLSKLVLEVIELKKETEKIKNKTGE